MVFKQVNTRVRVKRARGQGVEQTRSQKAKVFNKTAVRPVKRQKGWTARQLDRKGVEQQAVKGARASLNKSVG